MKKIFLKIGILFVTILFCFPFCAAKKNSIYGYYYEQLNEQEKRAYNLLYNRYQSNNTTQDIRIDINQSFEVTIEEDGEEVIVSEKDNRKIQVWLENFLEHVTIALLYDHPELTWIDYGKIQTYSSYQVEKISSTKGIARVVFASINITSSTDGYGTKDAIQAAIERARERIETNVDEVHTREELVREIHDYLTDLIRTEKKVTSTTKHAASYRTAFSGFFDVDGNGIVEATSEGYAKAFKVLCDYYEIPCIVVNTEDGFVNGVYMNDKKWYFVNVMKDDMTPYTKTGIYSYQNFLIGTNQMKAELIPLAFEDENDFPSIYPSFSKVAYGQKEVEEIKSEEKNFDLSAYANMLLNVYPSSRVTNITSSRSTVTIEGYMFKMYTSIDQPNSIYREVILIDEKDPSKEYAYRQEAISVYNPWLNKNMLATQNGMYNLDYANYQVTFNINDIYNFSKTQKGGMRYGTYLLYMRISDGENAYVFPLVDYVLSDGSTLEKQGKLINGLSLYDQTTRQICFKVY